MGENETVTGSPAGPVLPPGEVRAAEAVLARAWGEPAVVQAAERIWGRSHVVRLRLDTGRAAVLKRRRDRPRGRSAQVFGVELATLQYLNAMPVPVAPRLLGADTDAGILLLEDLGEGTSLADSLLAGERSRVQADLIAYAQALGSLHAWSMGRPVRLPRGNRPSRDGWTPSGAARSPSCRPLLCWACPSAVWRTRSANSA